jgi:hypothetical protein
MRGLPFSLARSFTLRVLNLRGVPIQRHRNQSILRTALPTTNHDSPPPTSDSHEPASHEPILIAWPDRYTRTKPSDLESAFQTPSLEAAPLRDIPPTGE